MPSEEELYHQHHARYQLLRNVKKQIKRGRQERPVRQRDWTPDDDEDWDDVDTAASERVLPRGEVIGPSGSVIGMHEGIAHYTVGQRKGLGISADRPLYISRIDPDTNRVYLDYDENCFFRAAHVHDTNWLSIAEPESPIECDVKVRYRDLPHRAWVRSGPGSTARIEFDEPVRAVTPGQSAVFYQGDLVLGGGVISNHERIGE